MADGRKNNGRKAGTTKNKIQGEITKKPRKIASAKKDSTDWMASTNDEFLKVREGESIEDWTRRTKRRRPLKIDNKKTTQNQQKLTFLPNGQIRFERKRLTGIKKELQMKIRSCYVEKTHDFMKNYSLVMRWVFLKYGVAKDDFEIGFYFYDEPPFTAEQFNLLCIQLGTVRGVFSRFYKNGYISPIEIDLGEYREQKQIKIYSFTQEFKMRISKVYEVIAKLTPAPSSKGKIDENREAIRQELLKMYEEANEIIKGIRKPEPIRFRNEINE